MINPEIAPKLFNDCYEYTTSAMRRVITVSRQTGTDGYIVARHVANQLGFQIFDKKLIA